MKTSRRFELGDRVRKHSGSWWEGRIVGFYSTSQTPIGYCVQLDMVENGPVQIYPENALAATRSASATEPKAYIKAGKEWHPIGSLGPLDREKISDSPMDAIIFGLVVGVACSAIAFFLIAMVLWA